MVDLSHGAGKAEVSRVSLGDTLLTADGRSQSGESVLGVAVTHTTTPRPRPTGTKLGFGRYLTDHVLVAEHDAATGWQPARIVPTGSTRAEIASGALQYGLSIFEGLKAFKTDREIRLFRPDAHAKRFALSAKRLCMPEVPVETFINAVRALVRVDADWCPAQTGGGALYIRPTLYADESFLGVRPAQQHVFSVLLSPVDSYWDGEEHSLKLWAEREFTRAALGGVGSVKTGGNYASSLLAAKRAKERGYDQVLWLDAIKRDFLEEAGTMNVFARIGDTVITPPLQGTILPGITRDSCLTLLREWGVPVEERPVSLTELGEAQKAGKAIEMWGTGTAAVISPIGEVAWEDGSIKSTGFEVAPRLRKALDGIQSGRDADTHGWIVSI